MTAAPGARPAHSCRRAKSRRGRESAIAKGRVSGLRDRASPEWAETPQAAPSPQAIERGAGAGARPYPAKEPATSGSPWSLDARTVAPAAWTIEFSHKIGKCFQSAYGNETFHASHTRETATCFLRSRNDQVSCCRRCLRKARRVIRERSQRRNFPLFMPRQRARHPPEVECARLSALSSPNSKAARPNHRRLVRRR